MSRRTLQLMRPLAGLVLMLTIVACGAGPASVARAAHPLSTGLVDDGVFEAGGHASRLRWLGRAAGAGAGWVRLTVWWNEIAPAALPSHFRAADPGDPHYTWSNLDASVRDAATQGRRILLQLLAPPAWALGANPPPGSVPYAYRPSASAVGAFATAVARRYAGGYPDPVRLGAKLPRVPYFQVFNEPNLRTYLSPQWSGKRPVSPGLYRALLNSVYAAVKAVQPDAVVLAAGLAPYGDPPGVDRMHPLVFLRGLLCLDSHLHALPCRDPAHFDVFDMHPYSINPTRSASNADDVSVPNLARVRRILTAARRAHTVLPRGGKPLWVTEVNWDSNPPDHFSQISLSLQARYVALALYRFWHQGVDHVFWFGFRDVPYKSLTGSGLYFRSGQAKPALRAFTFPLVVLPGPRRETLWGRAPHPGAVTIQIWLRRGWRTLRSLVAGPGRVFLARWPTSRPGTLLRAVQGNATGAAWRV